LQLLLLSLVPPTAADAAAAIQLCLLNNCLAVLVLMLQLRWHTATGTAAAAAAPKLTLLLLPHSVIAAWKGTSGGMHVYCSCIRVLQAAGEDAGLDCMLHHAALCFRCAVLPVLCWIHVLHCYAELNSQITYKHGSRGVLCRAVLTCPRKARYQWSTGLRTL
jgi:hypothetical protein